jgi:hypothetical protein
LDDRTGTTKITAPSQAQSANRDGAALRRQFPTIDYLRRRARWHIPNFAFEYGDGGAGSDKASCAIGQR